MGYYARPGGVPRSGLVQERMSEYYGDTYETPGYYLRAYRIKADLTQAELAKKLNIKQHHVSEMEHNKRSIGKTLAKKLATVLNCDYRRLL